MQDNDTPPEIPEEIAGEVSFLGGRQEIGTFGIKSSVRQRPTEEFGNKEEEEEAISGSATARWYSHQGWTSYRATRSIRIIEWRVCLYLDLYLELA